MEKIAKRTRNRQCLVVALVAQGLTSYKALVAHQLVASTMSTSALRRQLESLVDARVLIRTKRDVPKDSDSKRPGFFPSFFWEYSLPDAFKVKQATRQT
jgi:hypothetical protein